MCGFRTRKAASASCENIIWRVVQAVPSHDKLCWHLFVISCLLHHSWPESPWLLPASHAAENCTRLHADFKARTVLASSPAGCRLRGQSWPTCGRVSKSISEDQEHSRTHAREKCDGTSEEASGGCSLELSDRVDANRKMQSVRHHVCG